MPSHYGKKGGKIAPDGRPSTAPGIGKNAKRHDLERPKTPGLHGSDLQQGDVQMFEQGQRVQPIREQRPAASVAPSEMRRRAQTPASRQQGDVPDARQFLMQRTAGTLNPRTRADQVTENFDPNLMPLLRRIAGAPGASGLVGQMYVSALGTLMKDNRGKQIHRHAFVDLGGFDDDLRRALGE